MGISPLIIRVFPATDQYEMDAQGEENTDRTTTSHALEEIQPASTNRSGHIGEELMDLIRAENFPGVIINLMEAESVIDSAQREQKIKRVLETYQSIIHSWIEQQKEKDEEYEQVEMVYTAANQFAPGFIHWILVFKREKVLQNLPVSHLFDSSIQESKETNFNEMYHSHRAIYDRHFKVHPNKLTDEQKNQYILYLISKYILFKYKSKLVFYYNNKDLVTLVVEVLKIVYASPLLSDDDKTKLPQIVVQDLLEPQHEKVDYLTKAKIHIRLASYMIQYLVAAEQDRSEKAQKKDTCCLIL